MSGIGKQSHKGPVLWLFVKAIYNETGYTRSERLEIAEAQTRARAVALLYAGAMTGRVAMVKIADNPEGDGGKWIANSANDGNPPPKPDRKADEPEFYYWALEWLENPTRLDDLYAIREPEFEEAAALLVDHICRDKLTPEEIKAAAHYCLEVAGPGDWDPVRDGWVGADGRP